MFPCSETDLAAFDAGSGSFLGCEKPVVMVFARITKSGLRYGLGVEIYVPNRPAKRPSLSFSRAMMSATISSSGRMGCGL